MHDPTPFTLMVLAEVAYYGDQPRHVSALRVQILRLLADDGLITCQESHVEGEELVMTRLTKKSSRVVAELVATLGRVRS